MHPLEQDLLHAIAAWDNEGMGDAVAAISGLVFESEVTPDLRALCRRTCKELFTDALDVGADRVFARLRVALEVRDDGALEVRVGVAHKAAAQEPARVERFRALGFGASHRLPRREHRPWRPLSGEGAASGDEPYAPEAAKQRIAKLSRRSHLVLLARACARFASVPALAETGEIDRARATCAKLEAAARGAPPPREELEALRTELGEAHDAFDDDLLSSLLSPFLYALDAACAEDDAASALASWRATNAVVDALGSAWPEAGRPPPWDHVEGQWLMRGLTRLETTPDTIADLEPREPPWQTH